MIDPESMFVSLVTIICFYLIGCMICKEKRILYKRNKADILKLIFSLFGGYLYIMFIYLIKKNAIDVFCSKLMTWLVN